MRAAQVDAYGAPLVVREVPTPEPGPGEVLVRVAGVGVCHSDVHLWSGELPMLPELPWTLGHENAGHVHKLGPGVTGVEVGEAVAIFGGWGCGACVRCRSGDEQLCDVTGWAGIGRPGGFAEYVLVPSARHLVPLGDLDPVTAAPLTDAGLTPYRAVKRVLRLLVPGATAVTIGLGGLGQYGLQYLKLLTAADVAAVDIAAHKRTLATELGADLAVDPGVGVADAAASIRQLAPTGAAAVIDYVGSDETLSLAASVVAPQGTIVIVGIAGGALPVSFLGLPTEATVTTSYWGTPNELREVIALARRGRLHHEIVTEPLEAAGDVLARLQRGEVTGRVVLTP